MISRVLATTIAVVLMTTACTSTGPSAGFVRRPLSPEMMARKGIAYSGYRIGQSPDLAIYPSEEQIAEDLALLLRGGWGMIRLFDSGPHAERVLAVIADQHLDLKVMLGVWIAGKPAEHDAANREQIERCVALIAAHPDLIVAVSVGNETLDDWSSVQVTPAELTGYIEEVRARVTLPVTTDDSWYPFILGEDGETSYADVIDVAAAVDFLSLHIYAFAEAFYEGWDWRQEAVPEAERARAMMDAAVATTKLAVRKVRTTMADHGLDLPIIVGEIGWKSTTMHTAAAKPDDAIEVHMAHPVNQKLFYGAVHSWIYGDDRDADSPITSFYFEAFDEPWKDEWGDDGWGLFDVERRPRYVLWDSFPDLKPPDAPAYTDDDGVFYRPPVGRVGPGPATEESGRP